MKRMIKSLGMLLLVAVLFGCIDERIKVYVFGDGSGVIEKRVVYGPAFLEMRRENRSSAGARRSGRLLDESGMEELRRGAWRFGPGVTFMEAVELPKQEGVGYVVRYAFEDVGRIHLDQEINTSPPYSVEKPDSESITFSFRRGGEGRHAELIVHNPVHPVEVDPAAVQRVKEAGNLNDLSKLEDGGISILVEVMGDIVECDAEHLEDGTVTLLKIDCNTFYNNDEYKAILQTVSTDLPSAKTVIRNFPGNSAEMEERIRIVFGDGPPARLPELADPAQGRGVPSRESTVRGADATDLTEVYESDDGTLFFRYPLGWVLEDRYYGEHANGEGQVFLTNSSTLDLWGVYESGADLSEGVIFVSIMVQDTPGSLAGMTASDLATVIFTEQKNNYGAEMVIPPTVLDSGYAMLAYDSERDQEGSFLWLVQEPDGDYMVALGAFTALGGMDEFRDLLPALAESIEHSPHR